MFNFFGQWVSVFCAAKQLVQHSVNTFQHELLPTNQSWTLLQVLQSPLRNDLAINVVKESVELGVKLSSDFLAGAHSEKHYQYV